MKYETDPKEWSNAKRKREMQGAIWTNVNDSGRIFFSELSLPEHWEIEAESVSPYVRGIAAHTAIDDAVHELLDQHPRPRAAGEIFRGDYRNVLAIFDEGVRAGATEPDRRDAAGQRTEEGLAHISDVATSLGRADDGSSGGESG